MAVLLINPYFIGDTVLLEPIARRLYEDIGDEVYIISNYPELLVGHPNVKGAINGEGLDQSMVIDFTDSIRSLEDRQVKRGIIKRTIVRAFPKLKDNLHFSENISKVIPNKIASMYEAAGFGIEEVSSPRLYLTQGEEKLKDSLRELFDGFLVGVVLYSRHEIKDYPYTKLLIKSLLKKGYRVFVIGETLEKHQYLKGLNIYRLLGLPWRTFMTWVSAMDVVVGPDTGPMHVASALGVPSVVVTRNVWKDIYEHYPKCSIITSNSNSASSLKSVPVDSVINEVESQIKRYAHTVSYTPAKTSSNDIALFRLDGLGGSITMTDQAKKIFDLTGIKPILVVRNYKDIFKDHPYVKDVIEVGYVKWDDTLEKIKSQFDTVCEIRFCIGKWHIKGKTPHENFIQDFSQLQGVFDQFPRNYRDFEIHGLHHIQLTDRIMGLPHDKIESKIHHFKEIDRFHLPKDYVLINDGVDIQHQGMRQTKTWYYWNDLIDLVDMPFVQVGSRYDKGVIKAHYDLRDKTDLGELSSVVKNAKIIITTEGGIMHLAYAVEAKNVFILRGPTRGKLFEYPGHHWIDSYLCNICWSSTDDWYINCPRVCDSVCMSSISSHRVAYNISRALNENRG